MQIRSTRLLGCIVFLVGLLLPIRAQSPLADAFADSGLVTQVSWNLTTVISTNVASAEPGEPAHAGYPARASQWTRFRFEQDGYAHIPLLSIGALRFAVYTGESLGQLHEVASAHVMERWQAFGWEVQAGVTYHLAIDLPARGTLIGQTHSIRGNFSRVFLRPQTTPWPSQAPATVTWEFVNLDPAETPLNLRFSINGTARPAITAPPWAVTTTVPAGGIVNVQVDGQTDQRFLRDVPVSTRGFRPPNDHFAEAIPVPLDAVDWTGVGNTILATSEDGEPPYSAFMGAGRTVWWRWTPAFTGNTRIQWSRETLQLFRGNALTNLVQLPDDPRAGFRAEAGTSYAFRIANPFSASLADIAITLTRTVLSLGAPNDHLMETNASGAREIHVVAGRSHSFPVHELNPLDAYATLQLEQETPEGWQTVATTSASPRSFALSLASGEYGHYRVTGTNQQGALRVSDPVWVIAAPAHDRFEDAIELPAEGTTTWTWTGLGSAGRQPGEPDPGPGVAGGSLWYRWTPASTGTGRILLPEVTGPTTVTVYTGTVLTSLVPIASKTVSAAGGPIELPFPVDDGTAYSIAVIGAEPTLPASLGWIPVRVESMSPEQTAGRPVRLAASQSSGTPVEVTWLLQGEVLTTMTPMPTATDLWTPSQPGGFSIRATIPWEGGTVVLFETVGTVRPVNDRPENAATAESWEGVPGAQVATGSLLGASRDSGVPSAFEGGSGTVWFDWTLPIGTPRIRQAPGEAPVRVEVFEVTAGGALTALLSITNLNHAVDVPLPAGTVCKLAVSSADIGAQTFTLYLGQAPANDDFARAELLGVPPAGGSVTLTNANVFATTEPDEAGRPDLVHFERHGNLWWRFTAPGFGTAEFHLLDSPVPGIAAVYTGTALTNLQVYVGPEVANGNPVAWVPFSVQPGQTYWIAAGGHPARDATLGPVGGTFTYTPTPSHLANDDFANRIPLRGESVVFTNTIAQATRETGEPANQDATLWWEWVAPSTGAVRVQARGLEPNSGIQAFLYRGASLAELIPATRTDEVYVAAGERLQIAVGVAGGNPGAYEFRLQWRTVAPPSPNDAFANRILLPTEPYAVDGNLQDATVEPGEVTGGPGGTLWWKFVAPTDGVLELTRLTSDSFTPQFLLFPGDSLETLGRPLDGILGPRIAWTVVGGQVYSLQISAGGGTPGEFQMETRFTHPINDAFTNAIVLTGANPVIDTWLSHASVEPGEPLDTPTLRQSLWWRWTAPADGRLDQLPIHELLPPATVYEGSSLATLRRLPNIPPAAHLGNFSAVAVTGGMEYWIQFAAPAESVFALSNPLRFEAFGTPDNDAFEDARRVEGRSLASSASTRGASRQPGEPLDGATAGTGSLWWLYTAHGDGTTTVQNLFGSVSGVRLVVYQGTTVDTLVRRAEGIDRVSFPALRGEPYWVAAEVPTAVVGDVGLQFNQPSGSNLSREPVGNLVRNFSFEGNDPTANWTVLSGVLGVVGSSLLPADGANLLTIQGALQQRLDTQPGHRYRIRFAVQPTDDPQPIDLRIRWAGVEVGRLQIPDPLGHRFWHWRDISVDAIGTESLLEIVPVSGWMHLDAVSVVPTDARPAAVAGPSTILATAGGTVVLTTGVTGSEPLNFAWYRGDQPVPNGTQRLLTLNPVRLDDAGEYRARVSNPWGSVTSAPITLRVEGGSELRILRQPVGEAVVLGQYLALDVLASGTPPFAYQWFRNGEALASGTQRQLVLDAVTRDQLGTYEVRVTSAGQTILSLPAPVIEAPVQSGGGLIRFAATERAGAPPFRVTDVDGTTLLEGDTYVAQLYVGTNPETLRPIGTPAAFLTGASAGRWIPQNLMLPHIAPGVSFQAQVRVWDRTTGASYEEARASGGRFGRSAVTSAVAGNPLVPPEAIDTFQAFSLTAGLPGFTAGIIEPVSVTPEGSVTWKLTGAVGFRYLLERLSGNAWSPIEVIPNFPGTWTFTTPPAEGLELYRARVLD